MTLEYADVAIFESLHTEMTARAIAETMVNPLSEAELRAHAIGQIESFVEHMRRGRAREVEESVTVPQRAEAGPTVFERARQEPGSYVGNRKVREQFVKEMGADFPQWYAAGLERVMRGETRRTVEGFESDWATEGPQEYFRNRLASQMAVIVNEESTRIRLEVTEELLSTVFALGDGTRVTWGEATIQHHEQRIKMLTGTVVGTMETSVRHQAAVAMIRDKGVTCLRALGQIKTVVSA